MSFERRDRATRARDERFARTLLESARGDRGPADVEQAWARFAAAAGPAMDAAARAEARLGTARKGTHAPRAAGTRAAAAKWMGLGAVSGSALTAAIMFAAHLPAAEHPAAPATSPALASPAPSEPPAHAGAAARAGAAEDARSATPADRDEHASSGEDAREAGSSLPAGRADRGDETARRAGSSRARAGEPRSAPVEPMARVNADEVADTDTLKAQIALLDSARVALARGDTRAALQRVARFEHAYPDAELAPDAEVIAIEALAAEGDRSELDARAAAFLARHPDDPHAPRVRRLRAP